jgi:hypothetical protein
MPTAVYGRAMPTLLRPVVNFSEAVTKQRLQGVAARHGAEVCIKVWVADVLPINGSGISNDLFGYGMCAHFDNVVVDDRHLPLFAVEFDGPHHTTDAQARENDL